MKKRSFWQENLKNQLGVGAEINSADSYCLVHQRQKIRRKNEGKERDFLKNPSRIATHKHKGQGPKGRRTKEIEPISRRGLPAELECR